MLYVAPTPVGNLEDITLRTLRILKEVQAILAEDTRVSLPMLRHYGIDTPVRAYHAHNEHRMTDSLVREMQAGASFALISDAGTPGIADAGFLLVRACRQAGIPVYCLPGATSFIPALIQSGIPCDRFHFEGFLPHKKGRQTRLQWLAAYPFTFVLFEGPTRLLRLLDELTVHCGPDRQASVSRELTKWHEETLTASLADLRNEFGTRDKIRGELVIVVEGAKPGNP